MIRREESARTVQRVVDNFERLSALNKSSSLSSCCRSDKDGLLINGPYQMLHILGQHESKDRILSSEKGISLLFQYFLCFVLLCSTAKKWGGSAPGPPGFDAPVNNKIPLACYLVLRFLVLQLQYTLRFKQDQNSQNIESPFSLCFLSSQVVFSQTNVVVSGCFLSEQARS